MRLSELLSAIGVHVGPALMWIDIKSIRNDSRQVGPGDLFVAIRGTEVDGHRFIQSAIDRGASAVLCEKLEGSYKVPVVLHHDTRAALPMLAATFYGHPSKQMRLIGVTGTKGKTTSTHLIRRVLTESGHRVGLIGTINNIICDQERPARLTTPDSIDLQHAFREMADCGSSHAVMEVSSHALDMKRVDSTEFDIGVFTNLSQDHLDYHKTMERYMEAKSRLFRNLGNSYAGSLKSGSKAAIINADDQASPYMRESTKVKVLTYGIDNPADIRAKGISYISGKCSFTVDTPEGGMDLNLKLVGKINVYNSLCAIGTALVEGVPLDAQKKALESVKGMPGRFEPVDSGQVFYVVVDYAHSPDSLLNVLKVSREMTRGRVIVAFGCGGDRDRTKRPIMGRIAGELADYVIITTDNPRSEDPESILDEIEAGLRKQRPRLGYAREVSREAAIHTAIGRAEEGDVVLIAGKGHETYQIFRDETIHFDDREVALSALEAYRKSRPELFEREV